MTQFITSESLLRKIEFISMKDHNTNHVYTFTISQACGNAKILIRSEYVVYSILNFAPSGSITWQHWEEAIDLTVKRKDLRERVETLVSFVFLYFSFISF